MGRANYYDVYTKDGALYMKNKTSAELSKAFDVPTYRISKHGCSGYYLFGKYKIVRVGEVETEENRIDPLLLEEWTRVRDMFSKVIWVQKYEPGIKRLGVKKVG